MTGPPIVELGFSVELEEELSGARPSGGYEVTVPGLTEWGKELAELGLGDLAEVHDTLIESLLESSENIWQEFIGSTAADFIVDFGEFLRENEVAQQLLGDNVTLRDFVDDLTKGDPAVATWAFEVNVKMVEIFFDDFLPFLADWVVEKDLELDRKIDKNLERDREGGGGSAADDSVEDDIEDAVDDFFDETDQDDFQPEDVEDFADEVDDMAEEIVEIEEEFGGLESALGGEEGGEQLLAEIRALRKTLEETRAGLARPLARMGQWERM
jgi:hypothetical protein